MAESTCVESDPIALESSLPNIITSPRRLLNLRNTIKNLPTRAETFQMFPLNDQRDSLRIPLNIGNYLQGCK